MKKYALLWALVIMCLILCSCKNSTGSAKITAEPVSTYEQTQIPTEEPSPEPTPRPSEITTAEYDATDITTGETVRKQMCVYLPAGYNEDEKYNAVFLMHVSGCDETFWPGLGIQDIMDSLISDGKIEKTIVFMPDGYIDDEYRTHRDDDTIYIQFASELRNDIFPFVRGNFAVYDGREHFAFVGASFGSYMTVNSALGPNLDLIDYFGCIGGGTIDQLKLENAWSENGTGNINVGMLYIAEGEYDDRGPAELSSIELKSNCEKFNDDNLIFDLIEGVGHDDQEWISGFEYSLQYFGF